MGIPMVSFCQLMKYSFKDGIKDDDFIYGLTPAQINNMT